MPTIVAAGVAGLIFGVGLMLSGMARPDVVIGFLDPLGHWNPALGFVMVGAIPVAAMGFALAKRRGRAALSGKLHFPDRKDIDASLLIGAIIFGVGWGIAGVCPAPALTLFLRAPIVGLTFMGPMLVGLWFAPKLREWAVRRRL